MTQASFVSRWSNGIRFKFVTLIAIPTVAILILFAVALSAFKTLSHDIFEASTQEIPSALSLGALNSGLMTMTVNLYEARGSTDEKTRARFLADAKEEYENFQKEIEEFKKFSMSDDERKLFADFTKAWETQKVLTEQVFSFIEKGNEVEAGNILRGAYSEGLDPIDAVFSALDQSQTTATVEGQIESERTVRNSNLVLLLVGLGSIAALLAIGILTVNSIVKNLSEIRDSLNDSSTKVSSTATKISESSQQLSEATTEQASSLEETAASIVEVSSMVARNSENAKNSASISAQSREKATEGKASVDRMVNSMHGINESNESILTQIEKSNQQMTDIVKVIQEIGNKTKVINDIVFQTKLLSFNASVEAARAGEHGKGFSVVAEEVGNLAEMSGNAAKEITQMLDENIAKVEAIVEETKAKVTVLASEGRQRVSEGTDVVRNCSEILNEILQAVTSVSSMSLEISNASDEQTKGVNEINQAIVQLNLVTQQNATTSEEAANAAKELSLQTEKLNAVVQQVVVVVDGGTRATVQG